MKRLWRQCARWLGSLVEDHPSGAPTFAVCAAFEETECTLRGCYALGHCRLHDDPGGTAVSEPLPLSAGLPDGRDVVP